MISIGEWLCLRRVHLTNKLRFHRSRYIPSCLSCAWVEKKKRSKNWLSDYCQMLACNIFCFNPHGNPKVSLSPMVTGEAAVAQGPQGTRLDSPGVEFGWVAWLICRQHNAWHSVNVCWMKKQTEHPSVCNIPTPSPLPCQLPLFRRCHVDHRDRSSPVPSRGWHCSQRGDKDTWKKKRISKAGFIHHCNRWKWGGRRRVAQLAS